MLLHNHSEIAPSIDLYIFFLNFWIVSLLECGKKYLTYMMALELKITLQRANCNAL